METILDGIVLSSSEYRENDAILTFLGRDDCKYRVVARGVQKIGSKNAGALLPGTQSSFTLELKENRTLHAMKQARVSVYRRHIGESLLKQALSSSVQRRKRMRPEECGQSGRAERGQKVILASRRLFRR